MKLKVKDKENEFKLDGIIKRVNNKFSVELEVPSGVELNSTITNIKGNFNELGNITLVNNKNLSIKTNSNNSEFAIYEYEAGYIISSHIDQQNIQIKSMQLYFKEFDYFFIKDGYKIDIENIDNQLTITQKYKSEVLLENENLCIEYIKTAGIKKDEYGHNLFLNPSKVKMIFKKPLKLPQIFEEIARLESCFGFVIDKKMNLIDIEVCDVNERDYSIIAPFQKAYEEIILDEFQVVDIDSKELLKLILKMYYQNQRIATAVNMYYEYIYNDLDIILEFTSLVNTLELLLTDEKYKEELQVYAINNNEQLKSNNENMMKIFKKLTKKQCNFIKSFYRFENVELRDKIKYIFYNIFKLEESESSDKYISKIINTRNYYVHGGNKENTFNNVDTFCTNYLLRSVLYVLISDFCSINTNTIIETYKMMIPTIYEDLIKHIKKDEKNGV